MQQSKKRRRIYKWNQKKTFYRNQTWSINQKVDLFLIRGEYIAEENNFGPAERNKNILSITLNTDQLVGKDSLESNEILTKASR